MFVKHVCPSNDRLFDKQHWPNKMCILHGVNLKINRSHLLVMANLHIKFEDPRSLCSQVIDQTRF